MTFKGEVWLKYHIKNGKCAKNSAKKIENKELGYECKLCKKVFKGEILLKYHIKRIHTSEGDCKENTIEAHDNLGKKYVNSKQEETGVNILPWIL